MTTFGLSKIMILTLLLFAVKWGNAQQHQIGLSVGNGRTYVGSESDFTLNPFKKENSNFLLIGLSYYYKPKGAIFRFKTGMDYDFRAYKNQQFNYFVIPLGLDFIIGKKIDFIIGFGFQTAYLFSYRNVQSQINFDKHHNDFQLKAELNFGIGYNINKKWKIDFNYQMNTDMISMYSVNTYSSGGAVSETSIGGYENYLELKFIITINNHNNEKK